jgi:3-oxoacyl-[acyl-carrier protein] reductase
MTTVDPPALDFTGKTVIVTGGAAGFGAATARAFAKAGAQVVIADRNLDGAKLVACELPAAIAAHTDVTREEDLRELMSTTEQAFGRLDALVNNAAMPHLRAPFETMTTADIDFQFTVNLRSVMLASKYALPLLRRTAGSSIVNVASIGAVRPRPGMLTYSTLKGGVIVFTRGLAAEVAPDVRVNAVTPVASETGFVKNSLGTDGYTDEMRAALLRDIPMGRTADPTDIADAILFLASEQAKFLTGVILDVDGGRSI